MTTLYITEQQAIVRKTSDRLYVEKDDRILLEVPCRKLTTVMLFGNVQFTTQAAVEMLDHGIELALLSRNGRLRGQLTPPETKNVHLRLRQYERSVDPDFCLDLSRRLVSNKIRGAAAVWQRFRGNHPKEVPLSEIRELKSAAAQALEAGSMGSLLGTEGAAARRHFSLLAKLIPAPFEFPGRKRRPPPDPVNALLSFAYVLAGVELQALLDGMGFDPYLGVLHQTQYGRPSLALDLLEEFRAPLVDRFVLRLVRTKILRLEHFRKHPNKGVRLTRLGQKRFFPAWEKALEGEVSVGGARLCYRELFRRQVERYREALEGVEYNGFRMGT